MVLLSNFSVSVSYATVRFTMHHNNTKFDSGLQYAGLQFISIAKNYN